MKKVLIIILDLVAIALLGVMFWLHQIEEQKVIQDNQIVAEQYALEKEEQEAKHSLNLILNNSKEPQKLPNKDKVFTKEQFYQEAKHSLVNKQIVKYQTDVFSKVQEEDNLLLYFEAKSNEECCEFKVDLLDINGKIIKTALYYVNGQNSAFYWPITGLNDLGGIQFSIVSGSGGIDLGNVTMLNAYGAEFEKKLSGVYILESEYDAYTIDEKQGIGVKNAQDVICDERYMYVGALDCITISDISNPEMPVVISSINGFGTIRRLALANNGTTLVVASREYGVYLVNIENPIEPYIIGYIDSLELASGVEVNGQYLFIASRYYGIEIYDISNPAKPRFCSAIKSGQESERIDCTVDGNYLYTGVWGTKKVEIFDVRDVSNPKYIGYFDTDGAAYGLCTYEEMLIVSTGFHSTRNENLSIEDVGYGLGNGISIYDISNPEQPKWESTVQSDGRYYYIGRDYWNVKVVDGLAYFSDLYNGLYVYDITNAKQPKRIAKFTIPVLSSSENYIDLTKDENVFSYDSQVMLQSPIMGTAIYNDYLYVASENTDVHTVRFEMAKYVREEQVETELNDSGSYCYEEENIELMNYEVEMIDIPGQTYSIVQAGDKFFVGCTEGIRIYDEQMNLISLYKTENAVRDLKIVGNRIYTAEGLGGVSIYQNVLNHIEKIGNIIPEEETRANVCSQIGVSPDGNWIVASCRLNLMQIIDATNPEKMYVKEALKTGAAYYRNICKDYFNGNTIYISHANGVSEIIFNEDGYQYNEIANNKYYYSSACFAVKDVRHIVAICNKGYQVLDVSNGMKNVVEGPMVMLKNRVLLKGYPVIRDNIMVVTYPTGGKITIVDLTDIENPVTLCDIAIEGNPDVACITEDGVVYVPSRYEGIVKITTK